MAVVIAQVRLGVAVVAGLVAAAIASALAPWQVTVLVGWDVAAAVWAGSVWVQILGKDAAATRALATTEDDSRAASEVILLAASVASLIGVAVALVKAAQEKGAGHAGILALAAVTVVVSWAVVHSRFTLRYARLYYAEEGGIDYHDDRQPDYGDFAYVAFTLGMTYQVSDTDLVSKVIRMSALRHALLSYLFGTVVVAMTINVVAGLFSK